jgi:hypothetical protein
VRAMFRRAAKYSALDRGGELTEAQWSEAHNTLMGDLCELFDFGAGDA